MMGPSRPCSVGLPSSSGARPQPTRPRGNVEGSIDLPEPGTRIGPGVLSVEGWAAYGTKPVLEVFAQAGVMSLVRASPCVRGDVAEYLGLPALAKVGFRAEIDLRHLAGQPEQQLEVNVMVLVQETRGSGPPEAVVQPLGSVAVVVQGASVPAADPGGASGMLPEVAPPALGLVSPAAHAALNRFETYVEHFPAPRDTAPIPPGTPASLDGSAFLQEARVHADIGLPVPKGSKRRFAKRLVALASWPFLRHQVEFNHAVLAELTAYSSRVNEDRAAADAQLRQVRAALERLAGELRFALDRQLAETNDLLRQQSIVQRHQLDLVQRQAFQRNHEELGRLHSELAEMALKLDDVLALADASAPWPVAPDRPGAVPPSLEATYATLVDSFRGPYDIIKQRASEYLDDVLALDRRGPVLDVGSGRGEWLEVLAESGVQAYGVDLNAGLVASCSARGLDVRLEDALDHLAALPEDSLAVVTAIHVAEHLPTQAIVELIDRSLRALHPGGLLVLETPNPENLVVGSSTFYIDPGHLRPLNPEFMAFLVGARGFKLVEVRRKHPAPALPLPDWRSPWAGDLQPIAEVVNQRLFGALDYAVVARRP